MWSKKNRVVQKKIEWLTKLSGSKKIKWLKKNRVVQKKLRGKKKSSGKKK